MRNVRNFWIRASIDGRPTDIGAGPRAKDGGFSLTVLARSDGSPERVLELTGKASDGHLTLTVETLSASASVDAMGRTVLTFKR